MYNKRWFHKANDKKLLHKVKKHWVTISVALLALIGSSALVSHVSVSASSNNNSGSNNTQSQTDGIDQSHSKLVAVPHTHINVQNTKDISLQSIQQKANQVHKNILTHAMMTPTTRVGSFNNNNTSRNRIFYEKTVNGKPAKKISNINHLHIHHVANYKGYIFSRISTPFKNITINHPALLHNHVFLNEDHPRYGVKHGNIRILKAYKQYGHDGIYTRYLIHIRHKNHYITGNNHFVSFVAPTKHYRYYQRKINNILKNANNHKFNKVRRAVKKLNRKHITNYKRYMNLYINAYNLEQNIRHPVVVNYHHKYIHYKRNHGYNDNSQSTSDLVKFLNTPASNGFSNHNYNPSSASSFNIPNILAPINPFIPSNNKSFNSNALNKHLIPNTPAFSSNNNSESNVSSNLSLAITSASSAVQSASSVLRIDNNRASVANSVFNSVKDQDSIATNYYTSASQSYKLASTAYDTASNVLNSASKASNSVAKNDVQNFERAAQNSEISYSIIMNDTSSAYNTYALASASDSNAISVLTSADSIYSSASHVELSLINNEHNSNPIKPSSNNSDINSYYASSAAKSADDSIANSYRDSISASVSVANQSKAKSAARSADQSIENSIADSAKSSADSSIAASMSNSVNGSLSQLDSSIANSYAKSTENTSSYKNSVSVANSKTASLAAKLADNSLDDFIAGSYAKSADDSIADSYSASVSNSVSVLDKSIANSAARSADQSIANSYVKSANNSMASSAAKSADDSIANSYKNSVSASLSVANQNKASLAAQSADKSIDNSIANSAKNSADNSINASIANSAAKSTENTNSYKNSLSVTNGKTASLAAQSADSSIDASIADSAQNSANTIIANSYKNSVSNSVAQLDKSIANSAAKSADKSIAAYNIASTSQSSVISQFINETLRDVNNARQASGLNELQLNTDLENVSKLRAKQLIANNSSSFESDVNKLGYMELETNVEFSEIDGYSSTNSNYNGKSIADNMINKYRASFLNKSTSDIGIGIAYNNKDKNYCLVIDKATKIPKIPSNERYLIPDNDGKSITLDNIDSDGTYSGYNYSKMYGPSYIINTRRNVLGYNFDEITFSNQNTSPKFWVFSDELSKNPSAKFTNTNEWNNFVNTFNQVNASNYTPDELNRINVIRQWHNKLLKYENSNDISTSEKKAEYRQHIVDWVNFYRSLHGLNPVTEDSSFDAYAQQHAETKSDPECMIIDGNPKTATSAPNAIVPSQIVDYYTDTNDADHSGTPSHRVSILNPRATKIGVGEQGSVNTLYFGHGINNPIINQSSSMTYPNEGVYPINYVNQNGSDYWGYSFIDPNTIDMNSIPRVPSFFKFKPYSGSYKGITFKNNTPLVSVYDNTSHKPIEVSCTHSDSLLKGNDINSYSGAIYYKVDTSALRANHEYKITISGQGIPNGSYSYLVCLFEL